MSDTLDLSLPPQKMLQIAVSSLESMPDFVVGEDDIISRPFNVYDLTRIALMGAVSRIGSYQTVTELWDQVSAYLDQEDGILPQDTKEELNPSAKVAAAGVRHLIERLPAETESVAFTPASDMLYLWCVANDPSRSQMIEVLKKAAGEPVC